MPRTPHAEGRREEIVHALWRVMAREGPERASMRAIAREAGYTTGVLSHYFRDKRELMEYGSTLLIDRVIARVTEAARRDPVAAFAELLPLDDQRRDESQLWLTILGRSTTDSALAEQLARGQQQVRQQLRPVIAHHFPTIATDDDRIRDTTDQILAVADGLTVDALTNPDSYPPNKQLALLRIAITALTSHLD